MAKRPIYYDTETTGVRAEKDRIVEIAAFDPTLDRTFCELVNPGMAIPKEASNIHKITDEMVSTAPNFSVVGKAFVEFCGEGAVLIAHNNDGFDRHFLRHEFERSDLELPDWDYVDTLKWSRKYRSDLPRHSLQHLREVYGIPANQAHRALDDVVVLHAVFTQMIDDLSIETVLQLLDAPLEIQRMPFGKHQGKALKDVPKNYVSWLKDSGAFDKPQNKELKEGFEKAGVLT
jgi:DNA polymerase-3 subunit epsilon